jgi:hypothetical protein
MSELPLVVARGPAPPADPLGRVYTPLPLARAIAGRLFMGGPGPAVVVEPSVGPGAFLRAAREAWPAARRLAVDLDPLAEGLALADESLVADWTGPRPELELPLPYERSLCLGNPPYVSRDADGRWVTTPEQCAAHIEQALARCETVAFILPLPYLGQSWFNDLSTPAEVWPLLPRPWSRVREVAVFVWRHGLEFYTHESRCRVLRWKEP